MAEHDAELLEEVAARPRARRPTAVDLVARGAADEVTTGKRPIREWVRVPGGADRDATVAARVPFAQQALDYVTGGAAPSRPS